MDALTVPAGTKRVDVADRLVRLREETEFRPKAMVHVGGRPARPRLHCR